MCSKSSKKHFQAAVGSGLAEFLSVRPLVSHGNLESKRFPDLVPDKRAGFLLGPAPATQNQNEGDVQLGLYPG